MGFPVAIEGYGLGYNKAMLEKAGIDPATLTNFAAIEAAFEKINSMKAELGIDAVISMAASMNMSWVTGLHSWNTYLTNGLAYDDFSVADLMLEGEVDTGRLAAYARYVDLIFTYADQRVLLTGGYDDQINAFAMQKTAFIHQVNWADPNLLGAGMAFEAGYAPHPFLDEDTDGIFVAAPSWYVVNSQANNIEEAKAFLAYMAANPLGHDYMVNIAGMVPAFNSVTLVPEGPFSKAVMEWSSAGKIYNWQQYRMPDGFGMDTLGAVFLQFASGDLTQEQFVERITSTLGTLK
jgi:raffinose/stachyose/melibiose transport system substrate-binding protein